MRRWLAIAGMYRWRLSFAFVVLVALVCGQAVFVSVGASRVHDYARHSRLTSDLLSELLELSANKQRLRVWAAQQLMGVGASADVREQLLARMHDSAARLVEMSQRHAESWQALARREGDRVPDEVAQLTGIARLLDDNIVELQRELRQLQPLDDRAAFSGVWQQVGRVFDTQHGRDLRELVNGAIERQRRAVPVARAATERGLDRLRLQAALMALLTCAAAVGGALHLHRRLQRPLAGLLAGTQALQAGELAHRIAVGSGDEFDHVARRFNEMAAELQQHRREADAARRRLEDAVQARTAELQAAHETLQRLDRRRRQLFADLGHELRTPATAIRGEAQITLRGGDRPAEDYRQALHRIVGGVEQLTGVVDDLLLVAQAEADPWTVQPAPLPLAALWHEVVAQAETLAQLHGMRLQCDAPPPDDLRVQADAARLRQALVIVLDNAVRYSHPGGTVQLQWRRSAGHEVTLQVHDHGIGIEADELPQVFERFVRGRRAREHRADGTGIGLSIAQGLVQAHHGRLDLHSAPGRGTRVDIVLPCTLAAHATPDPT